MPATGKIYPIDDRQRPAIQVVVENVPRVKAVEDYLVWVEPMSRMVIGISKRWSRRR
jgi:hypothetical protein